MEDWEGVFEELEDPRTGNAKWHELLEILVIWFCTLLSGGETCADMALFGRSKLEFLQEFLRLEHGANGGEIPGHGGGAKAGQWREEVCETSVRIDTPRRPFDSRAARRQIERGCRCDDRPDRAARGSADLRAASGAASRAVSADRRLAR
jgi:hypothetical protein